MTSPLGKGLESLIPWKKEPPQEAEALDVLAEQAKLKEPVYRFHDEVVALVAAEVVRAEPVAVTVEEPLQASVARPTPRPPEARRSESVFWIDVAKIEPNPYQPRRGFDVEQLTSLAGSISEHGMLQPLLVTKLEIDRPSGLEVRYQLIAGERRWRAAKLAGMREVPAIIRTAATEEREKLELALIENVQREDLNPIERARAFEKLVAEFGLMQKEVAERIGKSREVVANSLRLLRLPEEMQSAILANSINESHARVLLTLEHNPEAQVRLFNEIRASNLSVRDAGASARLAGAGVEFRRRGRPRLDPDTRALQRELEELFGTRVKLMKQGEHGKIIVEFFSEEELRGILERISKPGTTTEL